VASEVDDIASDLIRGALVMALVFVHDLYVAYAILFTMSVGLSFFVPAQSVAVRTLVPIAGLMAVNGLMSQAQQGSLIVAPSIAGELVQLVGANSCFLYDSFSSFLSAALAMTLTIDRQGPRTETNAVLDSMRQGFDHFDAPLVGTETGVLTTQNLGKRWQRFRIVVIHGGDTCTINRRPMQGHDLINVRLPRLGRMPLSCAVCLRICSWR
jgi:MFS family permease